MSSYGTIVTCMSVAPLAGAWIEIPRSSPMGFPQAVAPLAGAWIEIHLYLLPRPQGPSLPSRERGLKYVLANNIFTSLLVAPLAGAWIEIQPPRSAVAPAGVAPLAGAWIEIWLNAGALSLLIVAPLAGAWIEIVSHMMIHIVLRSLPSRERGLKSLRVHQQSAHGSRSPRGSVD